MSLSTDRFKTYPIGCYCPTPAKARGQSSRHTDRPEFARLKHLLLAARTRVGPGLLTNKLIKEDHLHCVHHKDVWDTYIAGEYQPRLSTRLQPACNRIFRPGHVSTPTRPSSHPRGFRLFTCQRASLLKSYVVNLYRFAAVKLFSPRLVRFRLIGVSCSAEGGGIISFVPPLSIGCREDFCPTFTSRWLTLEATRSKAHPSAFADG